jgi:hypothetical protein
VTLVCYDDQTKSGQKLPDSFLGGTCQQIKDFFDPTTPDTSNTGANEIPNTVIIDLSPFVKIPVAKQFFHLATKIYTLWLV